MLYREILALGLFYMDPTVLGLYCHNLAPIFPGTALMCLILLIRRHGDLMVSALYSGLSGPGSSPGRGHCVVFLGKTLYSHNASLHPGVQMGTSKYAEGNPVMD